MERAAQSTGLCSCNHNETSHLAQPRGGQARKTAVQVYLNVAEKRFKGVKRCC